MSHHSKTPRLEELLPEALLPEELLPKELVHDKLWQRAGLWRASSINSSFTKGVPTGFKILDEHLPGQGWPADGVTELLHEQYGIGELRLLAPALARLSQEQNRWLLWVSPPYIPYPPALLNAGINLTSVLIVKPKTLADTLWVLEKALTSKSCSAVLAWPGDINAKQIRRLQVASKKGSSWSILFRPRSAAQHASPAELRIQLYATPSSHAHTSINLKILKRRGGWASEVIKLHFSDSLNRVTPDFQVSFK